jgi:hypothetical protein
MSTSKPCILNRLYCEFTEQRFVDRDMVMRHRKGGGVGHINPVQRTRHRPLDPGSNEAFHDVIQEVAGTDSDTFSELPEEELDPLANESSDDGGEDSESFELASDEDTGSGSSD